MSENSKIEWTDHTFNPWVGCTKVSPACDHCYAESWAKRSGAVTWGGERKRTSAANWRMPLKWNRLAAETGTRPRVFCASLADVFDNQVPAEWRRDLFDLIELTPNLDWLLLTKRIGNVLRLVAEARTHDWLAGQDNVRLGITVCNQEEADRDIPKLIATPARSRFLSIEPLLSSVSLRWLSAWPEHASGKRAQHPSGTTDHLDGLRRLDWVIVGGESGPKARAPHPDWFRTLRDECDAAGVAFLFKQWGEWAPYDRGAVNSSVLATPGALDAPMQRVGKTAAGRLLDGVLNDGYPQQ